MFSCNPGGGHGDNPLIGAARRFVLTVSHVEPIDNSTVGIVSREPGLLLEQRLAGYGFWVVNARNYTPVGKRAFARNPIATGSYKMDEWVAGEYIRLASHDDCFGGKPAAKTVTFVQVPEVSLRIAGHVSCEHDISVNIPPDQIPTIGPCDDREVERIVLDNTHMLVFCTTGPLDDKRVCQALSPSIDRKLLRDALWAGQNYTPDGCQLPSYTTWVEGYPEFEYTTDKARALLAEAG